MPRLARVTKKALASINDMQPLEIHIATIEDVVGAALVNDRLERLHIVHFPVGNVDKRRDGTMQIDERVQFDRCFGRAKRRPVEQGQAQIDRRRCGCKSALRSTRATVV